MVIYESEGVVIRDATLSDVEQFTEMREADKAEIWAEGHFYPKYALEESMKNSTVTLTYLHDGKIVGMFGVAPDLPMSNRARVWMLTSNEIDKTKVAFLKLTKVIIDKFLTLYPTLWNMVDARHTQAVKWLEWSGAKLRKARNYGVENLPFHYFEFVRGF